MAAAVAWSIGLVAGALLWLGSDPAVGSPVAYGLPLEADTYVDQARPTTNFGSSNVLLASQGSRIAVLKFNMSSVQSGFGDAWITLHGDGLGRPGGPIFEVAVHGYDDSGWQESSLTWNTYLPAEQTAPIDRSAAGQNEWVSWHVTEFVRHHVGKRAISFAVTIPDAAGAHASWKSRETDLAPTMYVQYGSHSSSPTSWCCATPTTSTSYPPTPPPTTTTYHVDCFSACTTTTNHRDCFEDGHFVTCSTSSPPPTTKDKNQATLPAWGALAAVSGLVGAVCLARSRSR